VPESGPAADGADSLAFAHAVRPVPVALRAIALPSPADQDIADGSSRVACYREETNDEAEPREASPASIEGTLSQSSIPSVAHRRRDPPSLQPIVIRCRHEPLHSALRLETGRRSGAEDSSNPDTPGIRGSQPCGPQECANGR